MKLGDCYWRFKGKKQWRYGWITITEHGLLRMGLWNGDTTRGAIVEEKDVDIKQEV